LGQEKVFDQAEETMNKLLGLKFCDKQIERISHHYGEKVERQIEDEIRSGATAVVENPMELHYAMPDGGMIFTREDGWKEMKVVRVFPQSARVELSEKRNWLKKSSYVAHLGNCKDFFRKVQYILDALPNLVIVADGAPWIWLWAEANYPQAIHILDFYHAKEHLHQFAEEYFLLPEQRKRWVEKQTDLLLKDGIQTVIKNIESLTLNKRRKAVQLKKNLLKYYRENQERMLYGYFLDLGLMIGSGPIEAAHRHLIQQRLKLSGQRWTIAGAQKIASLRVCYKSGQWEKVKNLIRAAA
jgi:hypothetical protein